MRMRLPLERRRSAAYWRSSGAIYQRSRHSFAPGDRDYAATAKHALVHFSRNNKNDAHLTISGRGEAGPQVTLPVSARRERSGVAAFSTQSMSVVESIDMSITVMGQKIDMPLFCAPTALQRLFHHDGERAVAKAAQKFGTMFGISSLGTISVEEIGSTISTPKLFQLYFHKDRGLTNSMIERCIAANFDVLALTVDTITGGNRERDLRTGFTSPPRLTLKSLLSFALHPRWAADYFMHEKFELPQLKNYVKEGSNISVSVGDYFSTMLDQSMNWQDAADVRKKWRKQFCLKGIMSIADAKRAVDIGATAIMVSNHGGRQLDGSREPV